MPNEPVRGSFPDPSLFSLSGLEVLRAYMRGQAPATPLFRLLGPRVTQASSGTAVLHQKLSPWFEVNEDFVDLLPTAEYALDVTALTGAAPSTHLRTVNLSLRYLRPCTVDDEMVIARGRILHAGSSFTTVEALIEDALGRTVAHAMGSITSRAIEPPPPPVALPLQPVEDPVYTTPDPARRPLDRRAWTSSVNAEVDMPPFGELLGAKLVEVTADSATVSMAASEWFCQRVREVSAGIVGMLGNLAIRRAIAAASDAEERFVILEASATLLAPVLPDGGTLTARGVVRQRRGDILVPEAQVTDADGRTVAMVHGACLLRKRQRQPRPRPGERVLLTVLFTDLVGSTDRARELGDARWRDLLEEHNAVVRRQIELDRGREVKTTGDGFLITFDSPSRAVQCARAIRQRLLDLDLEVRAGIHTGECELGGGDVSGLAVHVAARVQSAAAPGEILVSSTVRDLLGASDVALAERGVHTLKGLEGTWVLLAVTE